GGAGDGGGDGRAGGGPGTRVRVDVDLGHAARVELRVQVPAQPALAALPRLSAEGGGPWPVLARHGKGAVDLGVMGVRAGDDASHGGSLRAKIKALFPPPPENRAAQWNGRLGAVL